jgi:hypothetical protein
MHTFIAWRIRAASTNIPAWAYFISSIQEAGDKPKMIASFVHRLIEPTINGTVAGSGAAGYANGTGSAARCELVMRGRSTQS